MKAGIFNTTIEKIVDMGVQQTRHFKLTFDPGIDFDFEAGQFLNIIIESDPAKPVKRSYSIASTPLWKGYLDLCWKKVEGGFATGYLWTLKEGDKLKIQGPLGRFTVRRPLPETIAFVSTGTGIAPFRSMFHTLLAQNEKVQILNIFGNRYDEDILYQKEFEDLEKKYPNFKNVFTVSRPKLWAGEKRYVQHLLPIHIKNPATTHIYICGLTNMITEVQSAAAAMGMPKEQIFFEKYD